MGDIAQLLPCPFCGGKPLIDDADDGGSFIECAKCGASSAIHYDRMENLIPSWNRRALEADNARLRAALEAACNHVEWLLRYVPKTGSSDAAGAAVNARDFLEKSRRALEAKDD